MVVEGLLNPIKALKHPWEAFIIGTVYSAVAITISLLVFQGYASLVAIALTALVSVPLIYGVIKLEEKKTLEILNERILIKEHGKTLLVMLLLFAGFATSFTAAYILLPQEQVSDLFSAQITTIADVNSVTGNVVNGAQAMKTIIFNNLKVLAFCLLFAFFYGFGAIFILSWNASVIATAIGDFVRSNVSHSFISNISLGILQYIIHGIPEIAAYFVAGLAGGIISIAVIRHDFRSKRFYHLLSDSFGLVVISIMLILASAILEVYVSPVLV